MRITALERESKEASRVYHFDEGRKEAFVRGAKWVVDQLLRKTSDSPYDGMMDASTRKLVKELDLKDVHAFLDMVLKHEEAECPTQKESKRYARDFGRRRRDPG